jgi:putative NADH-flavin reductase
MIKVLRGASSHYHYLWKLDRGQANINPGTDAFPLEGGIPAGINLDDFAMAVLDETENPHHIHGHFTITR